MDTIDVFDCAKREIIICIPRNLVAVVQKTFTNALTEQKLSKDDFILLLDISESISSVYMDSNKIECVEVVQE